MVITVRKVVSSVSVLTRVSGQLLMVSVSVDVVRVVSVTVRVVDSVTVRVRTKEVVRIVTVLSVSMIKSVVVVKVNEVTG